MQSAARLADATVTQGEAIDHLREVLEDVTVVMFYGNIEDLKDADTAVLRYLSKRYPLHIISGEANAGVGFALESSFRDIPTLERLAMGFDREELARADTASTADLQGHQTARVIRIHGDRGVGPMVPTWLGFREAGLEAVVARDPTQIERIIMMDDAGLTLFYSQFIGEELLDAEIAAGQFTAVDQFITDESGAPLKEMVSEEGVMTLVQPIGGPSGIRMVVRIKGRANDSLREDILHYAEDFASRHPDLMKGRWDGETTPFTPEVELVKGFFSHYNGTIPTVDDPLLRQVDTLGNIEAILDSSARESGGEVVILATLEEERGRPVDLKRIVQDLPEGRYKRIRISGLGRKGIENLIRYRYFRGEPLSDTAFDVYKDNVDAFIDALHRQLPSRNNALKAGEVTTVLKQLDREGLIDFTEERTIRKLDDIISSVDFGYENQIRQEIADLDPGMTYLHKNLANHIALFGTSFSFKDIQELFPGRDPAELTRALQNLDQKVGLIYPGDPGKYEVDPKLRNVLRRQIHIHQDALHLAWYRVLDKLHSEDPEYAPLLAHHGYSAGPKIPLEEQAEHNLKVAEYGLLASKAAAEIPSNEDSIIHAEHALACLSNVESAPYSVLDIVRLKRRATRRETHSLRLDTLKQLQAVLDIDGQYDSSISRNEEICELGSHGEELEAYNNIGYLNIKKDDWDAAKQYFQRVLDKARKSDVREAAAANWHMGQVFGKQGQTLAGQGRSEEAQEMFERSVPYYKAATDSGLEDIAVEVLSDQCIINGLQGNYIRAIEYAESALQIIEGSELENTQTHTRVLHQRAWAYRESGQLERSLECHRETETVSKRIGDRGTMLYALGDLVANLRDLGDTSAALQTAYRVRNLAMKLNDPWILDELRDNLAEINRPLREEDQRMLDDLTDSLAGTEARSTYRSPASEN